MKTEVFDKTGREVKIGDTIIFPYVTPMGDLTEEPDFEKVVEFKYGCVGYSTKTNFYPLMNWIPCTTGSYIPNEGNVRIYHKRCPFLIKPIENQCEE